MAKMAPAQIQALAAQVGIADSAVAAAIAMAESGGNTEAHNSVPPDNSYGLWQINMLGPLGPQRRKAFGLTNNEQLYDPLTNAKAMAKISNGGKNWVPWTTYTSGKYKLYMNGLAPGDTPTTTPVVDSPFSSLADKISDSHFWARIGMYILGFVLILIGFVLIVGMSKAKQIGGIAKTASQAVGSK